MKLDYLAHHKFQPRIVWWKDEMPQEALNAIEQSLLTGNEFTAYGLNARNIRKQTLVTPLFVKIEDLESGIFEKTERLSGHRFQTRRKPGFHFS